MNPVTTCPGCQTELPVREAFRGKRARCALCGTLFTVQPHAPVRPIGLAPGNVNSPRQRVLAGLAAGVLVLTLATAILDNWATGAAPFFWAASFWFGWVVVGPGTSYRVPKAFGAVIAIAAASFVAAVPVAMAAWALEEVFLGPKMGALLDFISGTGMALMPVAVGGIIVLVRGITYGQDKSAS